MLPFLQFARSNWLGLPEKDYPTIAICFTTAWWDVWNTMISFAINAMTDCPEIVNNNFTQFIWSFLNNHLIRVLSSLFPLPSSWYSWWWKTLSSHLRTAAHYVNPPFLPADTAAMKYPTSCLMNGTLNWDVIKTTVLPFLW